MEKIFEIVWKDIFVPQTSLIELFVRATLIYFVLFALFRYFRRKMGALGISDILVVVLIATAAQPGLTGAYKSVTEAVFLFGTIFLWDRIIDQLEDKLPFLQHIFRPAPLLLIKNGNMLRQNMRQELITREELMSQLRQQGIDDVSLVKKCFIEGDGSISVVKKDSSNETEVNQSKKKKAFG
jgi:uncharacterized membrane protein YcaP (DUF421 family)